MDTQIPGHDRETIVSMPDKLVVYKLSSQEVAARYGLPNKRDKRQDVYMKRILDAVSTSESLEEAAELLDMTVGALKGMITRKNLQPVWGKKVEAMDKPSITKEE